MLYRVLAGFLSARVLALLAFIVALVACFSLQHMAVRLPFGLDCALVALAYYAAGRFTRQKAMSGYASPSPVHLAAGFIASLGLTAFIAHANGTIDLSKLDFGRNPLWYLAGSYAGIMMALCLAACFRARKGTRWLSANTLVIFPTHPLMFAVFTGILTVVLHLPKDAKEGSVWFTLGYTALALLLAVPLSWLLKRYLPAAVGGRRGPRALPA